MKLISIIGSPRSGTTYIAQQVAKILNVNLLPEAQWIISTIQGKEFNEYTKENWASVINALSISRNNFSRQQVIEIVLAYEKNNGLSISDAFIEHTPQNVLYLKKILNKVDFDHIIAPIRHPWLSISSLAAQKWFFHSEFRAAIFNFRCLFNLYLYRSRIKFIDIRNEEEVISKKLESIMDQQMVDRTYSGSNMILATKELKESHEYLINRPKKTKIKRKKEIGLLVKLFSIPSLILYYLLLRKIND